MTFQNPILLLFLSAALVALSARWSRLSAAVVFLGLNAIFVRLMYGHENRSVALLLAAVVGHFLSLRAMQALRPAWARSLVFIAWLVTAVVGLLVLKRYDWVTDRFISRESLDFSLVTIGFSFILFRQIHLGVDVRDRVVEDVPFLDYLNYVLAFWTFLAGPIQRFPAFREQFDRMTSPDARPSSRDVLLGLNRVAFGHIRMFILAPVAEAFARTDIFLSHPDYMHLLIFMVSFPAYLYLNFAGYCDIVIGFAQAVGFTLPENFNHPYIARNLNDFWNRFHITLSMLLRDYVYFPVMTALSRRGPVLLAMIIAGLVSFLIMGIWHGNTATFAVFGLVHGFGVVIVNLYTELLRRSLSKAQFKAYRTSRIVNVVAVVVCQSYVILAFLLFKYSWQEIGAVARAAWLLVLEPLGSHH